MKNAIVVRILCIFCLGTPHAVEGEVLVAGGKAGRAAPPNPGIGPWLRLLRTIAASQGLTPEFEVTLEATHHGPVINSPTIFVEIGSTEEYWRRQDAAQAIALLVWQGLGLGGGSPVGDWSRNDGEKKVLLGIGGGHYVPRHMDIVQSMKGWQRNAIIGFLVEQNIKMGKANDFWVLVEKGVC